MRAAPRSAVMFAICCFTASLLAQTTTGRILGTVRDQSGAAVAGAGIEVTDVQRGTSRNTTTDATGNYLFSTLPPGTYSIRAEAKAFKSVTRTGIELEVATDAHVDLTVSPGDVKETVVVSGDIPLINTTSATLGGTLSNQEINDLPLNGRNYENLLQLRPGVMRYPGGGFSTTSTNGLRAEDNAYLVEGLYNSEPFSGQDIVNGSGVVGDSATILPIDAIQEFNIQENSPAEYGWKPGAIVNVGLKSGTNKIHGTAFAFGRDGAMDARNYFNCASNPCAFGQSPAPKVARSLEQFGGSLGGAIIKDKAFFFGAYEGQRYDIGNSYGGVSSPSMVSLPVPATGPNCTSPLVVGDCGGSIPNAIADLLANGYTPATISHASQLISGCTVSGTGAVTCSGSGFPINNNPTINIVNGFPNQVGVDNLIAKVDYNFNPRSTVSGMYFYGNNNGTVEDFPELQSFWRSQIHTRAQVVGGNWIWTPNSRWVNEARVGYNRLYQPTLPGDLNTPASTYGLTTGVSGPYTGGLPRIGFAGAFVPGLGAFKWPKFQGPDTRIQFIDHVSYTAGKNAFKFGGELHRNEVDGGAFGNARGSITFVGGNAIPAGAGSTALEDFFAGLPLKASVQTGDPRRQIHNWSYAAFAQDDFRATETLTVNFGVRYEFSSVIKEAHNQLGNFDPNSTTGMIQVGINGVNSPYNPDHTNFGPRFGFAWDVTGKGSTVVRGGVGLMYESINWESFLAFNNSFGLGNVPTGAVISGTGTANQKSAGGTITAGNLAISPAVIPPWDSAMPLYGNVSGTTINCDPVTRPLGGLGSGACPIMSVARNLTTPYVWNWSLNVQHAFSSSLSLELAYIGNRGTNLTGIRDINQETPGTDSEATRPFTANNQFPFLAQIFQMGNVYRSNYNGLQATLNARNYHGLSMVAGYTYSHALDDVGANWDFGAGYGLPQDSTNVAAEYGNSDFDIRHRLTLSLTYAIPGKKGFGQMMEGWEINSIATIQSSQPWGAIDLTTDLTGLGGLPVSPPQQTPMRWDFFGNPSDFKSGSTPLPFFPNTSNPACVAKATTPGMLAALGTWGCYAKGNSLMIPPAYGTFGTMRRNLFPDAAFRNLDFSLAKNFHFGERLRAQFRAEFFNILNHPNFANPYGGQNGYGNNDPGVPGFGCGCVTPDVAAANPAVGSGGPRSIQLGLKLTF